MPSYGAGPLLVLNNAETLLQMTLVRPPKAGTSPDCDDPLAGGEVLLHREWEARNRATALLAPAIHEALAQFGLGPADLGGIACMRGPGSFTGLRLTLSTALGLSCATGAPTAGIEYLPLLALSAYLGGLPEKTETLWILTHARIDLVHAQGFAIGGPHGPKPLTPLQAPGLDEVAQAILSSNPDPGRILVHGSGLERHREILAPQLPGVVLGQYSSMPSPVALCRAAVHATYDQDQIEPLYLRPSDAEENLEYIAAKQGLDPARARRVFSRLTHE